MRNIVIPIVIVILIVLGVYFYLNGAPSAPGVATSTTGTETSSSTPLPGQPGGRCGGNTANPVACGTGYHCAPIPGSHLPFGDVGGMCVPDGQ